MFKPSQLRTNQTSQRGQRNSRVLRVEVMEQRAMFAGLNHWDGSDRLSEPDSTTETIAEYDQRLAIHESEPIIIRQAGEQTERDLGSDLSKVSFNPQPEPPNPIANRTSADFSSDLSKVSFNPQPEPPNPIANRTSADFSFDLSKVSFNPQPEPPISIPTE